MSFHDHEGNVDSQLPAASPQRVRWAPLDGSKPGIVIDDSIDRAFVPWDELQLEIEQRLLPQVRVVPNGSHAELGHLGDRENWVVTIVSPSGETLGHVWFGSDPDAKWKWDGVVRVGRPAEMTGGEPLVWQIL